MQLSCVTKSKKWRKEMGTMLNEEKKWYEKFLDYMKKIFKFKRD